jgi:heme-degrading monooxygenase HmoA
MSNRQLIVFRSRLRLGVENAYNDHAERMYALAQKMRGFIAAKDFSADDGERVALIEWQSPEELSIWRDYDQHTEAQALGRDRYYTSYDLRVCSELRVSKFDGSSVARTDRDPAKLRGIAERWLSCFEHRDLDGLLALYADDATHTSPKIPDRTLRGKAAMRAWWQSSFDRLPSLKYTMTAITADARRVYMEYVRTVEGQPDLTVAEVLDVEGGLIVASRVFHG